LRSKCNPEISGLFVGAAFLKNKDIPNMFVHVEGMEEQDADSPSWYNASELEEVIKKK